MSKASTIGLTLAQTALNTAIGLGIGLVVSLATQGIIKLINANKEAVDTAEQLKERYTDFKQTNSANINTLNELKTEFDKLSKGVSQYGDNISLTTEQYERYKEIVQQIVGMSPSLAEGYNTENGYIADKNRLLERAIELQETEYKNELRKNTNLDNLKTYISGYIAEYKEALQSGILTESGNIVGSKLSTKLSNALVQVFNLNGKGTHNYDTPEKIARKIIETLGIEDVDKEIQKYSDSSGHFSSILFEEGFANKIASNIDIITNALSPDDVGLDKAEFDSKIEILDTCAQSYLDMVDAVNMANSKMQINLQNIAEYTDGYSDLTTEQQKFVNQFLEKFHLSDVSEDTIFGLKFNREKMATVKSEVENFIKELSKDSFIEQALSNLYAPLDEKETLKEYQERINSSIGEIQKYCNEHKIEIPVDITNIQKNANELTQSYDDVLKITKEQFNQGTSKYTKELENAQRNLQNEYDKLSDWGLSDYVEDIKNGTMQSVFGNVDMDKRTIINWSDELKQTYADELASWNYDPEIGSIDTVLGNSTRFGEDLNGIGWEVAFTPILPDGTFLSQDTVYNYIESILREAYVNNGKVTTDELQELDKQGRQIGNVFVQGIFAGVDDSLNYDNNGNMAETIGHLMHFSGDFGTVKLAKQLITKIKNSIKKESDNNPIIDWDTWFANNIKTPENLDKWKEVINVYKNVKDAINAFADIKKVDDPLSISDVISDINTKLKPAFDDLGKLYQNIFKLDDGKTTFSLDSIDFSQFTSLQKSLQEIGVSTSVFEDLEKALTDPTTTAEQAQKAFNSLATSIIDASGCVSNLDNDTKNAMVSALKSIGVTNADEVVTNRLTQAEAELTLQKELASKSAEELANLSDEERQALINLAGGSDIAKASLIQLTAEQIVFNNDDLSVEQKVKNLQKLAEQYGLTAMEARIANRVMGIQEAAQPLQIPMDTKSGFAILNPKNYSNKVKETQYQQILDEEQANFKKELESLYSTPIKFNGNQTSSANNKSNSGKSGSGSGSGSKSALKTNDNYYNEFQAQVDDYKATVEKMETEIDKINNKLEKAIEVGDTELAKQLELDANNKNKALQNYLASSAQSVRNMAEKQILPIIYEIAPQLSGKKYSDITQQELLNIKRSLDNAIISEENAETTAKNNGNDKADNSVAIKSAEMRQKVFDELLSTLKDIDSLAGNENGAGEWAEKWSNGIENILNSIKDVYDYQQSISDFKISLFENQNDYDSQIKELTHLLSLHADYAKQLRGFGFGENSSEIQNTQSEYIDTQGKILDVMVSRFEDKINASEKVIDSINN